jgi:hypothetical protein
VSHLKEVVAGEFQYTVRELLARNKSILDLITKFQDANARVNRSIIKAVTQCGCIKINAEKQIVPEDSDFDELKEAMKTHLEGSLCDSCRDIIEREIGRNLFYLVSICDTLDLDFYDAIIKENERVKLLGNYN